MLDKEVVEIQLDKFTVYSANKLDGYGYQTAADAVSCINYFSNGRKYNHCLEWCSGPGYLGLGTLSQGFTKKLTLLDIFPPNKIVIEKTIEKNNLHNIVNFVLSDNFKSHKQNTKYDLIIGNPPHFAFSPKIQNIDPNEHRKYQDKGWKIHQDFFENVNRFITDNADIILMENKNGSDPNTFKKMIEDNDLKIVNVVESASFPRDIWYLHVKKD